VTAFGSKLLSLESEMCPPFASALNCALEQLANIQVNGLPEFKAHIVFVPCNNDIPPDCDDDDDDDDDDDSPEISLKFIVAMMSLEYAYKLHNLDNLDAPKISQFIDGIKESPSCFTSWKNVLSVVEMERKKGHPGWPPVEAFKYRHGQVGVTRDTDHRLGGELDTSWPTTRKITPFMYEDSLTRAGQRFRLRL